MGIYKQAILANPWVPWRIRNRLEQWTETTGRARFSMLYRWLHFGRISERVQPISTGPHHHFFGYYDKSPWNTAGTLLLAHEVSFNDRPPAANDVATIGVIDLDNGKTFVPIGQTSAWNWQQGSMLQWHPDQNEDLIVFNDRRGGVFVGVVANTEGREKSVFDRPIYAVTPDGQSALSLNFSRLHEQRPGYGYAGVPDPNAEELHPQDDGIFRIDLRAGKSTLLVTLQQLAATQPVESMKDVHHWVNHIQISPNGERFAFFHIWRVGEKGWRVRLYTAKLDGTDLSLLLDTDTISHYDWLDERKILVWASEPAIGNRFLLCDIHDGQRVVVGDQILTEDGHCSFSPDRNWVLNDTYPDRFDMRTLMLYRMVDNRRIDLARLYSPKSKWWGEIRCDLHPRWNRDGTQICIDSVHNGDRQLYVVDVEKIVR